MKHLRKIARMPIQVARVLLILSLFLRVAGLGRGQDAPAEAAGAPAVVAAPEPTPEPTPPPQVRIELRLLEWRLNNTFDFDFAVLFKGNPGSVLGAADLTLPASTPLTSAARVFLDGLDTGHGSFEAVIETLETVGEVKTLSEPTITTTIGAADDAVINSGVRVPYSSLKSAGLAPAIATEFRDTGVNLTCKALDVKYDQFVHLMINASVTDVTGFMNISQDAHGKVSRVPVLDRRKIENQVMVKNNSIFISGLLKTTREVERRRGVPVLSKIPGLRHLFSNTKKDHETVELVFLVRPVILDAY